MKRIAKMLSFAFLLETLLASCVWAQTINASSCSASDVQTAFNAVTSSTTTVNIPACSPGVGWTTQVTLTVPSGNTSLTIQGQTSCTGSGAPTSTLACTDNTVIIDDFASAQSPLIVVTGSSSSFLRLTGLTFQGGSISSSYTKYHGLVNIGGNSQNLRIDHNHFNTTTYTPANSSTGAQLFGCLYGVADHNIFDNPSGSVNNAIQEYQGSCNGDSQGFGAGAWAQVTGLGSANSFFLENNLFNNGASNDCLYGGRLVSRYNTFNSTAPPPAIQTHPTGSLSTAGRGCRSWEIYGNAFDAVSNNLLNTMFFVDSGTGVIWGNTAPSSSAGGGTGFKNFIDGNSARSSNIIYPQTATPNGWGYCGTNYNGTGSNWDQNSNAATGYACIDQIGRGAGQLLTGNFPSLTNSITGCGYSQSCAWPNEALEPVYEWLDSWSPVPNNGGSLWAESESGVVNNNRDYYLWCNAASQSGCTSFTGASGVGSGTLAARPSTCTPFVGYWATDQNTLYQCSATNTWTAYYTPYTYPHPLTQASNVLAPPTNVKAVSH